MRCVTALPLLFNVGSRGDPKWRYRLRVECLHHVFCLKDSLKELKEGYV